MYVMVFIIAALIICLFQEVHYVLIQWYIFNIVWRYTYSGTRYSTQWKTPQKWTVPYRTVPYHAVEKRHIYMIWRSFYSNETVKCSSSDSPSSSGDVVHVFMSFSETADAENTASITRFSMYVCSKWNRTSVSFINRDAEHAGFIFKVFLQLNIYRY